jgi:hypothetical protein
MGEPMPRIQQMTLQWRRSWLILVLATVAAGVSGCQHTDRAQQQVAVRRERLTKTVGAMTESEGSRTQQLGRSVDLMRTTLARQIKASRANVGEFKRYWQRDWNRWIERPPVYRQQIHEVFGAEPRGIGPDPITLFF